MKPLCPAARGRFFASVDGPHAQPVAMINQSMAKRLWPGEDPVGRRFRYGVPGETPSVWRTIVGVVGDTLPDGPESRESELDALGNRRRLQTWLLGLFSATALAIAAVGLYGLISYSVTERRLRSEFVWL